MGRTVGAGRAVLTDSHTLPSYSEIYIKSVTPAVVGKALAERMAIM